MRVAILKNRIYKGGVSQVLAGMIAVLNEQGIVPDLVTFRSDIDQEEMNNSYGVDIRFNVKTIFFNFKMPYEWNFLFFNWICRFYIKKYDFLINSNNTSFLLPGTIPVLSYVHFPRKQRVYNLIYRLSPVIIFRKKEKSPSLIINRIFFLLQNPFTKEIDHTTPGNMFYVILNLPGVF